MNDIPTTPALRFAAALMRGLSWLIIVALLMVSLFWGVLHGWIVPRLDEFRPQLETLATSQLGVPVRIGALEAHAGGMVPSFELRDVALLDAEGRAALRLSRVLISLSMQSVLGLGFDQLYVERPSLDIRRTAQGKLVVAGLAFGGEAGDTAALDWFLSQREFVIRGGVLRWSDELRGAEPLTLSDVNLVMRNSARRHEMRLDATPPQGWGERFLLIGQFRRPILSRHPGNWQDWDGQVFGDFSRVDVSRLHRHVALDIDVSEGDGHVRFWGDVVQGRLRGGTADLALSRVQVRLGDDLQPLELRSVQGRIGGRELAGGFQFSAEGLQFEARDGLQWPAGNVFVSHMQGEGRQPAMGEFRAERLDLAVLGQLAGSLPLGTAVHAALAAHPVSGLAQGLEARWQGALASLQRYDVRGRLTGLSVPAVPAPATGGGSPVVGWPGVSGAELEFNLTQSGGRVKFGVQKGWIDLPGVFEDPRLLFDRLTAEGEWQVNGDDVIVTQANARFANADAEGEVRGNWRTSDPARSAARSRFPGVLDLHGNLVRANGARVHRYLPLVLPQEVRHYVRDSVVRGQATGVAVRIRGDLYDLPYADPRQGEFRFAGKVHDTTFAFVPRAIQTQGQLPWPVLSALDGELIFDRLSMKVAGAKGGVGGAPGLRITRAEATISDLTQSSTVVVSAEASGPVAELLRLVRSSPLGAMSGGGLDAAVASGDAAYRLRLNLPIYALDQSKVLGSVTLAGNDVQLTPESPLLGRARGVVSFSENGFSVVGGQARLFGGDVRIEGGSRPLRPNAPNDATVVLRAQGTVTADGMRQAGDVLGIAPRLAQWASGSTQYAGVLSFRRGQPELALSSNLQGLALNLPAPLGKTADAVLPFRFDHSLIRESLGGNGPLRDQIDVELGRVAAVRYQRDISGAGARVLRGSIAVGLAPGDTMPLPDQGVSARIQLPQLNTDAWEAVFRRLSDTGGQGAGPVVMSTYLPTRVAVRAGELTARGRRLDNVVIGGTRDGTAWRANVDANQLNGYLEYREASPAGAGRLFARLSRLTLGAGQAAEVETLLDRTPDSVPALDIVVDSFELRGRRLGRVEVEAVNQGEGAREWVLNKFNVTNSEAVLSATGNWAPASPAPRTAPGRRRTELKFRLDVSDAGELLGRLGMKDVIRRGKGRMDGQVTWVGSPLTPDYPSLGGQFNINVESGQFLKAEPGVAKLLGVLSLQSLPRRLALDFRDVFSAGFAFDFIRGDVTIAQGIASTNNLQMKGVNAAVLMEGKADIARETQDLRVVVVPEINAGSASLVATVINPTIGLGTVLAQLLLRQPLIRATTQEFRVDGTWTEPRVTRMGRQGATDAAEPASAAGRP